MIKTKNWFISHRAFLIIFGSIITYSFFVSGRCAPWHTENISLSMYALDYSFGFTDKILPGALYHLFFKSFSPRYVDLFSTVLLVLFFIVLAGLLEKLYLSAEKRDRTLYAVVIFFFLTGPATFSVFVAELGIIEVFWFYLAALFFLLISRWELAPLTALLCVAALLVNSSAILVVVPMFCIILLYKLSFEKKKTGKMVLLLSFVLCVVVSIPFFVYLMICGKENMVLSYDEFQSALVSKGVDPKYPEYFFYTREAVAEFFPSYYGRDNQAAFTEAYNQYLESTGFSRLIKTFFMQMQAVRFGGDSTNLKNYFFELLFLSPPLGVVLVYFCRRFTDKGENRLRRFVFFCVPVLFVLELFSGFLFSIDTGKWISYGTLVFFSMFLFVFYVERDHAATYLRAVFHRLPMAVTAVYALIYAFTAFSFY